MAKVKQLKEKEISADPKVMKAWTDDELYKKQTELTTYSAELVRDMQAREYEIDFKSKKLLNELLKFLEKDAEWGHTTATGLIMLYHNLREAKEATKEKDWDGNIKLRAANVTILWTMVTKMTGKGFYSAKNFVELMAQIGQSLSTVTQKVHEDNQELRDVHANLGFIENEMENRKLEMQNETSLKDEVDPVVEPTV
tara:strand:- start:812 stop:1402 length:591 start_codon:yes stop_codon:yes gene_type:complete